MPRIFHGGSQDGKVEPFFVNQSIPLNERGCRLVVTGGEVYLNSYLADYDVDDPTNAHYHLVTGDDAMELLFEAMRCSC